MALKICWEAKRFPNYLIVGREDAFIVKICLDKILKNLLFFKYMIRPLLSLERLSFHEKEGKLCYQYGKEAEEVERMDLPGVYRPGEFRRNYAFLPLLSLPAPIFSSTLHPISLRFIIHDDGTRQNWRTDAHSAIAREKESYNYQAKEFELLVKKAGFSPIH